MISSSFSVFTLFRLQPLSHFSVFTWKQEGKLTELLSQKPRSDALIPGANAALGR
jgi:hypothetical protein